MSFTIFNFKLSIINYLFVVLLVVSFSVLINIPTFAAESLSPEEVAIKKLNVTETPPEVISDQTEETKGFNIPNPIKDLLGGLLDRFNTFTVRADQTQKAELPEEFTSDDPNPIKRVLNALFGNGKTAVYSNGVYKIADPPAGDPVKIGPIGIPGTQNANSQAKQFENAYYPTEAGIRPITGSN